MTLKASDMTRPATSLFPQFVNLYDLIQSEVNELQKHELDFKSSKWEWAKWSIRQNLSHIASFHFRWLLLHWGCQLFPNGIPYKDEISDLAASRTDRRLDETKYKDLTTILIKLRQGIELAQTVLLNETVVSIRSRAITHVYGDKPHWQEFTKAHPTGITRDPGRSDAIKITLEATVRHIYFESLTHMYNIQRLKRAQGLPTIVDIPKVGYWVLPNWDRSEP